MSIYICIALVIVLVLIFLMRNIKIQQKETGTPFWDIVLILLVFFLLAYILTSLKVFYNTLVKDYIVTTKDMLQILFLFILIMAFFYVLVGFLGKRYTLRVDKFNIGGINVLFDRSNEIYIKTVGTFISSKRSLFNFKRERDNIYEVLNVYYEVYNFIRSNLELLDPIKDKALYSTSVDILKMLNQFLTKHQNDYRRWYEKVISADEIYSHGKKIVVHETTIERVQKNYYRYAEILKDINEVNKYMSSQSIRNVFRIKVFDWEEK